MLTDLPEISDFGQTDANTWIAILEACLPAPSDHRKAELEASLLALLPPAHATDQIRFLRPAWTGPGPDPAIEHDDFNLATKFQISPADLEREVRPWAHGQCALLALRIHEWSGWPILATGNDHFCVMRPDGALVDAYGVFKPVSEEDCSHFETLNQRYEISGASWAKRDAARLAATCDDANRADADEFLDGLWMIAVFPPAHRLAEPVSYLPLEHEAWVAEPDDRDAPFREDRP